MEELIRLKIAELEEIYPQQSLENKLINEVLAQENNIQYDESEICLTFDSEVIDERKALDERIRNVRDLYIQEIRAARALEIECNDAFQENKVCISRLVQAASEHARKKKELKAQEELKNKLHEMCKLLQRQAKEIVEDSEKQRELERIRMSDLSTSFTNTINGISAKIVEQEELFAKQAEENDQLRSKLSEFQEHTTLRDSHFKSQLHAKDLELQLIEARRAQEAQLLRQEKLKSETYRSDITRLTNSKIELNNQLTLYSDKFDHFQDALTRSQKMFIQFEEKMVTMEQTVEKLENVNQRLKAECNGYDLELLAQLDLKEKGVKQYEILQRQKKMLSDECRILQTKRVEITNKFNELVGTVDANAAAHDVNAAGDGGGDCDGSRAGGGEGGGDGGGDDQHKGNGKIDMIDESEKDVNEEQKNSDTIIN